MLNHKEYCNRIFDNIIKVCKYHQNNLTYDNFCGKIFRRKFFVTDGIADLPHGSKKRILSTTFVVSRSIKRTIVYSVNVEETKAEFI